MNPSLPLRSPEMISLPLSLSQHKPRHRIGQGATSGSPGPLGAWVPGPSPRAEGPLWLPGLVWSLGPGLRLRGRPTRAHRGGPPPGEKTGWWPVPGGLRLWLGSSHRASGAAVQHVAKRWQHYTASGQRHSRAAGGAHPAGCVHAPGSGKGPGPLLQGSQWGPLLWLGLTEGVAHVASTRSDMRIIAFWRPLPWPLSQNCSLNLRGDLLFQCGTVWG